MPTRRQRGFALALVVWTIGLIGLIGARMTSTGRTGSQIAAQLQAAAEAEAAADGGIHEAILHLSSGGPLRWTADSQVRQTQIGGWPVLVRIDDLSGRINPNSAPPVLMAAFLVNLGVSPDPAAALAAAINDWRMPTLIPSAGGAKLPQYRSAGLAYGPPNQPYRSIEELSGVIGMTQPLLDRMRPFLSLYNESAIEPLAAAPPVRAALKAVGINQLAAETPSVTVQIIAEGGSAEGVRSVRQAIIRFRSGTPHAILEWGAAGD